MTSSLPFTSAGSPAGYSLVEALVAVALLGGAALGLAAALGQATEMADRARARVLEQAVLDGAPSVASGHEVPGGWVGVVVGGHTPCWHRSTSIDSRWTWVEARCRGIADLPMVPSTPGLLVPR
ncbi:MAG: hypothetical protein GKS06_04385 [Acidobacteria bacterium]|nr:hypothetical protein [Acidobacteriota bacterium]